MLGHLACGARKVAHHAVGENNETIGYGLEERVFHEAGKRHMGIVRTKEPPSNESRAFSLS